MKRYHFIALKIIMIAGIIRLDAQNTLLPVVDDCPVSRRYAYVWIFGNNAGLDFNNSSGYLPAVVSGEYEVMQLEGGASICNAYGELQLFTTGVDISLKNENNTFVVNGQEMAGYYSSTQAALIIAEPGNEKRFIVFQTNIPFYDGGLSYSIVDMAEENGQGKVILKNQTLLNKVCEKLTAVNNASGDGVWIISHIWDSDEFVSFLFKGDTPEDTVVSSTGTIHFADSMYYNAIGAMKVSPAGDKLALAIYGMGIIELFSFDNQTGTVYNPVTSLPLFQGVYGLEFSPNGSKLYASTIDLNGSATFTSRLLQFDLSAGNGSLNNPVEIASSGSVSFFGSLQLAPDGKIYIAKSPLQNDRLDIIFNPDRPGQYCNFNYLNGNHIEGINLETGKSAFGLPGFNQSCFDFKKFVTDKKCQYDDIVFKLTNYANVDSVEWVFSLPGINTLVSGDTMPVIRFEKEGNWQVTVTDYFEGHSFSDSFHFEVLKAPEPELGDDTTFVELNHSVTLDPGLFPEYLWSNGSRAQTQTVSDTGTVWVKVTNEKCCVNYDTTLVEFVNVFVPNAFTPNGDNLNDKIYVKGSFFTEIDFKIFNRLGEMVFSTTDQYRGWDGTVRGELQKPGVFYYLLSGTLKTGAKIQRKGNITLIR